MDLKKLDQEVERILSDEFDSKSYSQIRQDLIDRGFDAEERKYILTIVDEQGVVRLMKGGNKRITVRNMILGSVLSFIALLVIAASYFGTQAPREVYYVSLAIFAVGYLIFRTGFKQYRNNH